MAALSPSRHVVVFGRYVARLLLMERG